MRKFRIIAALALFTGYHSGNAQTLQQWANTVHWDGYTFWSKYIIMLPAHMGPNALPIPATGNGSIDNEPWISGSLQLHSMTGDQSQSIMLRGNYALVKDVISFDANYIPAEYYKMSDTLKRERHVYYQNWNDKKARGDLLLNIHIKLLKKWDRHIQLAMRIGYRYPSSNGVGSARFTDNMGYYLDLSAGKPIGHSGLKWIGMGGFYCWQIDKEELRQDDAFLFGTGFEWNRYNWKLQTTLSGYLGYLENQGDKPIVYRASAEKRFHNTSVLLQFQKGLKDYKYTTVEFGIKQSLGKRVK